MIRHRLIAQAMAASALLAALGSSDAHAEAPPVFLGSFGVCGNAPGQMQSLWGIAAGPDGSVFVADEQVQRVTRFKGTTGEVLLTWNVPNAFDVAMAPDGSVYVLRRSTARIDHYTDTGIPLASFGSAGSGDGQFNDPFGISIDPQGQIFVADTGNHRIQRLAADGTFLGKWGIQGGQIGELQFASEVAADNFGNVFVIDSRLGRVHRFSETGALLGWWYLGGPLSTTPMTLNYGLAVDAAGNVYVSEGSSLIDKYAPGGSFLARFGGYGNDPGAFQFVMTLACGAVGNIYVSDRTLCRVTHFGEPPVPALPVTWGRLRATYR